MTTKQKTVMVNGEERPLRAANLAEVLDDLRLDGAQPGVAVALNDAIVPRGDWRPTAVRPGDRIEIVGAVAGG
jgi:sulfur carrier protein